jgi:hypothetical protein
MTRQLNNDNGLQARRTETPAPNSTFAIGGVSCSAASLVVAESFVLRIKFSGKNPAHRKSAKRVCLESSPAHAGLNAVQEMEASIILRETIAKSERTGWSSC